MSNVSSVPCIHLCTGRPLPVLQGPKPSHHCSFQIAATLIIVSIATKATFRMCDWCFTKQHAACSDCENWSTISKTRRQCKILRTADPASGTTSSLRHWVIIYRAGRNYLWITKMCTCMTLSDRRDCGVVVALASGVSLFLKINIVIIRLAIKCFEVRIMEITP